MKTTRFAIRWFHAALAAAFGIASQTMAEAPAGTNATNLSTAASIAVGDFATIRSNIVVSSASILDWSVARTPAQRKVSSALLPSTPFRSMGALPPPATTTTMNSVSGDTLVECNVRGTVSDRLVALIESLGGTVVSKSERFGAIHAFVPRSALEKLAEDDDVRLITPVYPSMFNKANTSQGDVAHKAATARSTYGVSGNGVNVGVMSDSTRYLASVKTSGDLPSSASYLSGRSGEDLSPNTGEGTAMMEIVYDLAPSASLLFATGSGTEEEMAEGILALRNAGCNVIVDDITKYREPCFEDGPIAQAINDVTADGGICFSSAGNAGRLDAGQKQTWEGDFSASGESITEEDSGIEYEFHTFGSCGELNSIALESTDDGVIFTAVLQWSDRFAHSSNDYNLLLYNGTTGEPFAFSFDSQTGTGDPVEIVQVYSKDIAKLNPAVAVIKKKGASSRFLHLSVFGGTLETGTTGALYGHNAADRVISCAAASAKSKTGAFTSSDPVEYFSCDGPRKVFYSTTGAVLGNGGLLSSGGVNLQKPDITAADGVSCATTGFNPFYGTSAAAPHAAAIAALMLEANPSLDRDGVFDIMKRATFSGSSASWSRNSGYGILNALECVRLAKESNPATLPTIPASPSPYLDTTTSTTLKWSSVSGATHYRVYRSENPFADPEPYSGWITATSCSIAAPSSRSTVYYYWVKAASAADEKAASGFSASVKKSYDTEYDVVRENSASSADQTLPDSGLMLYGRTIKFSSFYGDTSYATCALTIKGSSVPLGSTYTGPTSSFSMSDTASVRYTWTANSSSTPRHAWYTATCSASSGSSLTGNLKVGGGIYNDHHFFQSGQTALAAGSSSVSATADCKAYSVAVTCTPATTAWTASADKSWVTLYKTSSKGSGTLGFVVDENTGSARNATITLKVGGTTYATFSVNQAAGAAPAPTVSSLSITGNSEVPSGAGTQYTCKANWSDGTQTTVTSSATWSLVSGSSYGTLSSGGYFSAYETTVDRDVTIKAAYGGKTQTKSLTVKAPTQTVYFDANGGSCSVSELKYTIGGTYASPALPTASQTTKTGYTFAGWWTSSSGGTQITASSTVSSSATRTLYAHWTPISYTVSYALGGGAAGANAPSSGSFGTAFRVSAPTLDGKVFAGWTVTSGLNSSTAKWGDSSSPSTAVSGALTVCFSGEDGDVWFLNLRSTSGSVTLTATWEDPPPPVYENFDVGFFWRNTMPRAVYLGADTNEIPDEIHRVSTTAGEDPSAPYLVWCYANFGEDRPLEAIPFNASIFAASGASVHSEGGNIYLPPAGYNLLFSGESNWFGPTIRALGPGNYTLRADLDPEDTMGDTNRTDNVALFPFAILPESEIPFAEALGCDNLSFAVGGDAETPFGQSFDGEPCVQFGPQAHDSYSTLSTTVSGAGTLSFQWKASCEAGWDEMVFLVDGTVTNSVSGIASGWTEVSLELGDGPHELVWAYTKDNSVDAGLDAAFLRNVTWVPDTTAITDLRARQRYPWNGLVDISFRMDGPAWAYGFAIAATNAATGEALSTATVYPRGGKPGDDLFAEPGEVHLVWDAGADVPESVISNAALSVTATEGDKVQLWEGGPYWATKNIGAEKPEDYGLYFWWGDTVGYRREGSAWVASDGSSQNFLFDSDNTPTFAKGPSTLLSEGWVVSKDGTTVLAPEHDAAHVHWGGSWRMPTVSEVSSLNSNCDWTWTTQNGVRGYVVRGRGDFSARSIFLPAAGRGDGPSLSNAGSYGYYWSSVPLEGYFSEFARSLGFYSGDHGTDSSYCRIYGQSVRPVQGFAE